MKRLYQKIFSNHYLVIISVILLIFLISANKAWLNPRPEFVVKTHEKIPIMWQYNKDAPTEFMTAAKFPEVYHTTKTRINRPTYPFTVNMIGRTISFILSPLVKLNSLERAMIGYIVLKLAIFILGALLLYKFLLNFYDSTISLFATIIMFLNPFSISNITTFHTFELQFITPIIIIFLFTNLTKNYSTKKNIIYSLIVGVLMLAKQNYAVYLAILLFSLLMHKKVKAVFISLVSHILPLILWLMVLKIYGLKYYNHETEVYRYGIWLYEDLIFRNPINIIQTFLASFNDYFVAMLKYYSAFVFLAIFACAFKEIRDKLKMEYLIFILFFLFLSWFQIFATQRYRPYMTADLSLFIYSFAAFTIITLLRKFKIERYIIVFLFMYLCINLIGFVRLPWVHPYDQKDYLESRQDEVERFLKLKD